MKKNILLVFITAVICITGTVIASNYLASQIVYNDTTVDQALDELYNNQTSTITGLNEQITTLTNEKTELQNELSIYDSADCVSGNVACTNCTSSTGQKLANFSPNKFVIYFLSSSNNERIIYYDKSINSNQVRLVSSDTGLSYRNLDTLFYVDDRFTIHSMNSTWQNETIRYIVCR